MFHVKPKENRNYNSTNTNKYNSRNHRKNSCGNYTNNKKIVETKFKKNNHKKILG